MADRGNDSLSRMEQSIIAPTSITNQAQHRTLTTQLENTKKELDQAENALRDAGAERAKYDPQKISQQIASAEDDY